jgi:hypothetical protein
MRLLITMTALAAAAGCDASSGPSQLDRARILAVKIAPPHLGPGETAPVEILIGRAGGTVAVVAPEAIALQGAPPEADTMLSRGAEGWAIACPPEPALAEMRARLDLEPDAAIPLVLDLEVEVDGDLLTASKLVFLGSSGDNPTLAGIRVDGAEEADDGVLVVTAGDELAIAADGAEGDGELGYAWFTSIGEIDLYLSESAVLTAEGPAGGQLALVVRDERGGVTWSWRDVRVE